jgi:murein DD-endopeptidase MepM/ murein hydrolase activator NlpD
MNGLHLSGHKARRLIVTAIVISVIIVIPGDAAYRITRPVDDAFPISQTYLYGEGGGTHRGIDFLATYDSNVYAVADGIVVDLLETIDDFTNPGFDWGNFVLIQHNKTHWDITSGQTAYVYSLYMHLRKWGVLVNLNDPVNAGMIVGKVDSTGNSTGNHLHLQIDIHPQPRRTLIPNTLDSENRTRNPELWLNPLPNTGTVVGKVTDISGNPIGGLHIYGLQKQLGWGYGWSETYIGYPINPDDLYVENWATTDVTPGSYHVTTSDGRDLGWHTVTAGQVTYIGLYPVYLPDIRSSAGADWDSNIVIRNNSDTDGTIVTTTFFLENGNVIEQYPEIFLSPRKMLTIDPYYSFTGSGLVVSSQDISVALIQNHSSPEAHGAYVGVSQPSNEVHIPLVHKNNYSWYSEIFIQNASAKSNNIRIYFEPTSPDCYRDYSISPHSLKKVSLGSISCAPTVGSARIISTSSQPVAVTATQYRPNLYQTDSFMESEFASNIASYTYAPLIHDDNWDYYTSEAMLNTGGSDQTVYIKFYYESGINVCYSDDEYVPAHHSWFFMQPDPLGTCRNVSHVDSAYINGSSSAVAAVINQLQSGTLQAATYPAVATPSQTVHIPIWFKWWDNWNSSLVIQNTTSQLADYTIIFYDSMGNYYDGVSGILSGRAIYVGGGLPSGSSYIGSVKITATKPIAVIVNHIKSGAGADLIMSHVGLNR